jgi:hypothetical protein
MMPPFEEDTHAHQVAKSLGFTLARRYQAIDVYDEAALKLAGWMITRPKPDFARIAEALRDGVEVPGARFRCMEYVLRPVGGVE